MNSLVKRSCLALTAVGLAALAGCATQQAEQREPMPAKSEPAKTSAPAKSGPAMSNVARMYFPTGDAASSALLVEEYLPMQARVGQPFDGEIKVTNISRGTLQNVMVDSGAFKNWNIASATPAGNKTNAGWQWNLGDMPAGSSQTIRLRGTATAVGAAGNCLAASFNNSLCAQTNIVQPTLAINKTITAESLLTCGPITTTLEVRNTGSGPADNVTITDNLPAGLTTEDGKQTVTIAVGTLGAGETKSFPVRLRAAKTGKYENTATATADGGLTATSTAVSTVVKQPVLAIECKPGQSQVIAGREATFDITVRNTGDAGCDVNVTVPTAQGGTVVGASEGGAVNPNGATWRGPLGPGQTKTVTVRVRPSGLGNVSVSAQAACQCAAPVNTSCQASVVGIPALLLDGIDEPDPVLVGENTTYTLRVTNQSATAPLTNVRLVCSMEDDGMQFVSATGGVTAQGKTITFPAIATLAPKESRVFQVVVKATKAGQVQLKAEASSKEITKPLVKTETTNFYQ